MKLGVEVCLGPGHIVLDGDPALPPKRGKASNFRPMSIVAKRSPISVTAEHLFVGLSVTLSTKSTKFAIRYLVDTLPEGDEIWQIDSPGLAVGLHQCRE